MKSKFKTAILAMLTCVVSIANMLSFFSTTVSASSQAIIARSNASQTVKFGPSTKNYGNAGSIDYGEDVYVLGKVKNMNWYHIQYVVSGTGKQKTGYVPSSTLTIISGNSPHEEIYNGNQRIANTTQTIWSCDDSSLSVNIGSIYTNEGVTELYGYQYSDSSKSYYVSYVEYSTSSGTKRGYIYNPNLSRPYNVSSVARVKQNAVLYYGSNTSYFQTSGGVDAGEFVTILAKEGDWVYVEYNTTSGRKRGYLSVGNLDLHVTGLVYDDFIMSHQSIPRQTVQRNYTIYSGPSTQYASIGTLNTNTYCQLRTIGNNWCYAVIIVSENSRTSGYIYMG